MGGAAELHDGGHVDGLDELVEAHGGRVIHAGVGGANGGVEAVGGHLVGAAGLIDLLGGRAVAAAPARARVRAAAVAAADCGSLATGVARGSRTLFSFGRRVGVGARLAVDGELAAVGDDEGLVLFGHSSHSFRRFRCSRAGQMVQRSKREVIGMAVPPG